MKTRLLVLSICSACLFVSGCITSLHPIYDENNVTLDPALEGLWEEDGTYLKFEKTQSDAYSYYYGEDPDELVEVYRAHLVRIGNLRFMDLYPTGNPCPEIESHQVVLAHSFLRVDEISDRLVLRYFDVDKLKQLFREGKVRLKHEVVEEDEIVLTASTEELQRFLIKYGDDDQLFLEDSGGMQRISSK